MSQLKIDCINGDCLFKLCIDSSIAGVAIV